MIGLEETRVCTHEAAPARLWWQRGQRSAARLGAQVVALIQAPRLERFLQRERELLNPARQPP